MRTTTLSAAFALPLAAFAQSSETIIGVYIFHRHGDRTPKALTPTNLTDLGYNEVYQRGTYYRSRYVASDASNRISGLNTDIVREAQIAVSAPVDNVLMNSAAGFLQGLYPPTSSAREKLRNGTTVESPMSGYQLIPVSAVNSGSGSENNAWLQDASGCSNAASSSNNYFSSESYMNLLSSTHDFYQDRILPVVNGTFNSTRTTFKNAYSVFDLVNVAEIHNATINSSSLLTNETLLQLRTLADQHEFGLAYNATDDMRAMAGMQLAGEVVQYLNNSINLYPKKNNRLGIQFGAYATFFSFFGLSNLTEANPNFYGVPDYASSMVFELFTTADVPAGTAPNLEDLQVRFLYHNGTSDNQTAPRAFPLFGGSADTVSWDAFTGNMSKFSVSTAKQWCTKCGNFTGTCAPFAPNGDASSSSSHHGGNDISKAVCGVIGAMVTLAVIFGIEALILLFGGFRVVSKKRLAGAPITNGATKA